MPGPFPATPTFKRKALRMRLKRFLSNLGKLKPNANDARREKRIIKIILISYWFYFSSDKKKWLKLSIGIIQ